MTQNLGAKQKNNAGVIHLESVTQRGNKGHFKWRVLEGAEHSIAHALQTPPEHPNVVRPWEGEEEEERVDEGRWVCKSAFDGENTCPGAAAWQVVGVVV